ncbi:hypothetical protein EXIGLDRAFT_55904 [Exidia glandulosa HHB12029]|uniref:Uncharacterized protein n=1 Tax=Exidia glandulosa HHB12029 TaxID=1314781 RepID=A0A165I967_EXIGL|nr:hypothetical protein EXIGLDRAFT_55904 [Exidia glandulosa HHB12029]
MLADRLRRIHADLVVLPPRSYDGPQRSSMLSSKYSRRKRRISMNSLHPSLVYIIRPQASSQKDCFITPQRVVALPIILGTLVTGQWLRLRRTTVTTRT